MATNRFEQPLASQFINTYVPIPFEQMVAAGQMKQERYDKAAAATDALVNRVEMINAIPNSPDDRMKKQTIDTIYNIRDKYYTKDLSDPFVQRELSNEIRSKVDSDWVQKAEASYASWQQAQAGKRNLEMNNKWNPLLDKDPATQWDSKQMGIYNYNPRAYIGIAEMFDPYYKDIKRTGLDVVERGGLKFAKEYVTDKQITDVTSKAAQELGSTPAGQSQIELYKMSHPDTKLNDLEILQELGTEYGKQHLEAQYEPLSEGLQRLTGGNNNSTIPISDEVVGKKGVDKNTSEEQSWKEWHNEEARLKNIANGIDENGNLIPDKVGSIDAKNKLMMLHSIDNKLDDQARIKQSQIYNEMLPSLYAKVGEMFQKKGKSNLEARAFIDKFLEQSNIENSLKDQRFLYKWNISTLVPTELKRNFLIGMAEQIGTVIDYGYNEENGKKIETVNIPGISPADEDDATKILKTIINKQFDVMQDVNDQKLEERNKLLTNQEAYTVLNNDYNIDNNGKVSYKYKDSDGREYSRDSAIHSSIKDFLSQSGNYEKYLFDSDGKPISSSKKNKYILKALKDRGMFKIEDIYHQPSASGKPRVSISVYDKNQNGDMVNIGKAEIHLPSDLINNNSAYMNELSIMNKPIAIYNLTNRLPIQNMIVNNDWSEKPNLTIPIDEKGGDSLRILYDSDVEGFRLFTTSRSNNRIDVPVPDNSGKPIVLSYNDLPGFVSDYIYKITD